MAKKTHKGKCSFVYAKEHKIGFWGLGIDYTNYSGHLGTEC